MYPPHLTQGNASGYFPVHADMWVGRQKDSGIIGVFSDIERAGNVVLLYAEILDHGTSAFTALPL